MALGDPAEQLDERLVCLARVATSKRGTVLRKSLPAKLVLGVDRAGQEALAERAEGDEADPELLERRQDRILRLTPPQRVLALEGGDRLHRMRATDRLDAGLGQAEVLDLAGLDQLLHRTGDLFDRNLRVDPVLVEEVDRVGLQPAERALDDCA